jgi:oligoendopeptidase F
MIDAFQHWIYQRPDEAADPLACDAQWSGLRERFMPGVDWTGLEEELTAERRRILHIYEVPFYYIEYGMAQLGAVQIWANALQDQVGTVARYRQALALGATRTLPELYAAAGARFAFDVPTLRSAVELMEHTMAQLDKRSRAA